MAQITIGTYNTGLADNTLVYYYFWAEIWPPGVFHSVLKKAVIEEPYFPEFTYNGWGMNITQLHQVSGSGTLIAKKNLYFMTWVGVITTYNSQLAYLPTTEDRATITDYYIFLLGNDSLRYSKWNDGSTFYPFSWIDLTSVEQNDEPVRMFALSQNYPNPFNPLTTISFQLPFTGNVSLKVYDLLGRELVTLVNEEKPAGRYEIDFDGSGLASGVYFYQLKAGANTVTKKMVLSK